MASQETQKKPIHISNASDLAEKTILVVEDDRTHRTLMEKILKDCGFNTVPAENGLIALSRLNSGQNYDLVMMDWDMPELNGLDAVAAIRALEIKEKRARIPIIAFTAHRRPGDMEKCLAAGMDAYLPKDVWMPKWRRTLVDNLQGLIAGDFDIEDFDFPSHLHEHEASPEADQKFDLDAIDQTILEEARKILRDGFAETIDEYLEDAASYIREIKSGMNEANSDKVARASHPLKSNSKGFGLMAVSKLAEIINHTAMDAREGKGDLKSAEPLVPQLEEALDRAERKLRAQIKNSHN